MQSTIQAVGVSPTSVCPAALLFTHPSGRVLINCGENFQRLSTEWRLRLSKLEDIVITDLNPECVGGLPGLLLTLEGLDSPSVDCPKSGRNNAGLIFDTSLKFGQTFVGNKWLKTEPTVKHIDSHFYRPIIKRKTDIEIDDLEIYGNSLLDDSSDRIESYQRLAALRHTVRGIRIWGPRGISSYLQLFINLCGRLQRLSIEILEFEDTSSAVEIPFEPLKEISQIVLDAKMLILPKPQNCDNEGSDPPSKKRRLEKEVSGVPCVFSTPRTYCPLISGRGEKQLGRFLIDKAIALKIPKGPMYRQLKGGESVTLADGRTIRPEEVCQPSHDGFPFLLIRCSNEEECNQLLQQLKAHPEVLGAREEGCLLFHDSPRELISSGAYQNLAEFVRPGKMQVVASLDELSHPEADRLRYDFILQRDGGASYPQPFVAVEALNRLLNESYGDFCGRTPDGDESDDFFLKSIRLQDPRRWKGEAHASDNETIGAKIENRLGKIRSRVPTDVLDEAKATRTNNVKIDDGPYVQLLGTGASIPSKYRNVSSTLLQIDEDLCLLLDCGEGTLQQLAAASCDVEDFRRRVRSIKFVFLSHKHADHIMGLQTLTWLRRKLTRDSLTICAANEMHSWIRGTCSGNLTILSAEEAIVRSTIIPKVLEVQTCLVQHIIKAQVPHGSYAIKLFISAKNDTHVVVFSGDLALTSAYQDFLEKDNPLDILIQEATFEDVLKHEAVARQHCTVTDCMTAARWGGAKTVVMTHFSQRYPTVPRVAEEAESSVCVCYGMDLLRVPLRGESESLRAVYGSMKKMLSSLAQWFAATSEGEGLPSLSESSEMS